jgi:glycosyltransferase involved in cell wall biosynthesis
VKFLVVDDGSKAFPARQILSGGLPDLHVGLVTLTEDVLWNRGGARNTGAHVASTEWILHTDLDHFFTPESLEWLVAKFRPADGEWYKFSRYRLGRADASRAKDALDPDIVRGVIHPHMDSYLIQRSTYWGFGGYDEDYSGSLGGGSPFIKELTNWREPKIVPCAGALTVVTSHVVPDASTPYLPRDKDRYKEILRTKTRRAERVAKAAPMRVPWRVDL